MKNLSNVNTVYINFIFAKKCRYSNTKSCNKYYIDTLSKLPSGTTLKIWKGNKVGNQLTTTGEASKKLVYTSRISNQLRAFMNGSQKRDIKVCVKAPRSQEICKNIEMDGNLGYMENRGKDFIVNVALIETTSMNREVDQVEEKALE